MMTDESPFYSCLSDKKQQQISAVLSNAASTSQSLSAVSIEENTKAESLLSGATSGSLFQNCQIATVNAQVYQFGRELKNLTTLKHNKIGNIQYLVSI